MKSIVFGSKQFMKDNYLAIIFVVYMFLLWIMISIIYNIRFKEKNVKIKKVMVIENFTNELLEKSNKILMDINKNEEKNQSNDSTIKTTLDFKKKCNCKTYTMNVDCMSDDCCVWMPKLNDGKGSCLKGDLYGPELFKTNNKNYDEWYYLNKKYNR